MTTANVIKQGTVYAGNKSANIHNEIIRIYTDTESGRKMADVDQYGATLANKEWNKKITFFVDEISYMLRRGLAHIVLVRQYSS